MIPQLYKCFQHWSATGSVYLYSDPHFGDIDLQTKHPSHLSDKRQIENLRQYCHKSDTLIILGDVGQPEPLKQLRCYKVLITGNHDAGKSNYEEYFNEIYEGPLTIGPKIILSHEPINFSHMRNYCGHVHDPKTKLPENVICVNPDYTGVFYPYNLGNGIKSGDLANITSIHRETIDKATKRKKKRNKDK